MELSGNMVLFHLWLQFSRPNRSSDNIVSGIISTFDPPGLFGPAD
jgi:hypothetical protein